jgi:hypothetical protein
MLVPVFYVTVRSWAADGSADCRKPLNGSDGLRKPDRAQKRIVV